MSAMSTTPAPAMTNAPATANSRVRSSRPNRRPHPNLAALKEHAFALACTGLRSPAIALQLHVPERTIRRWVNDTLLSLAQDALDPDGECDPNTSNTSGASVASDASSQPSDPTTPTDASHAGAAQNASSPAAGDTSSSDDTAGPATRPTPIPLERHRALAIESQRAVAATAHAAYDRLMARHDDLLDALATTLRDHLTTAGEQTMPASLQPSATLLTRLIGQLEAGASRHLRIAQAAHRDAARFQGVLAYAQTDAHLTATEAHAATEDDEDDEQDEQEGGLVPIEWVDPNDPTKEGLIPRSTFDSAAAIDDLCNGPTSSLDKLRQTNGTENHDAATEDDEDDEDDEQDEDAILAAIISEQAAGNSPAVPASSATPAATTPATTPATGAATPPATVLDERPTSYSNDDADAAFAHDPWGVYEERQRERRLTLTECQARSRYPPPTLARSNTMAALFLRNPHYVF